MHKFGPKLSKWSGSDLILGSTTAKWAKGRAPSSASQWRSTWPFWYILAPKLGPIPLHWPKWAQNRPLHGRFWWYLPDPPVWRQNESFRDENDSFWRVPAIWGHDHFGLKMAKICLVNRGLTFFELPERKIALSVRGADFDPMTIFGRFWSEKWPFEIWPSGFRSLAMARNLIKFEQMANFGCVCAERWDGSRSCTASSGTPNDTFDGQAHSVRWTA